MIMECQVTCYHFLCFVNVNLYCTNASPVLIWLFRDLLSNCLEGHARQFLAFGLWSVVGHCGQHCLEPSGFH